MMILKEGPRQSDFCELVGLLATYLQANPEDGYQKVKEFLTNSAWLWNTEDVCRETGWCRQYISQLCSRGTLPYIPGRPNKFVPAAVKQAINDMQQGAGYGRRKSVLKTKTTKGRK